MNKVFGVGLGRTGTKSLNRALRQLGFNCLHYPDDSLTAMEVVSGRPYSRLAECDGFTDLHATTRFEELDREYPGSKFILTVRNLKRWLESSKAHMAWYKANPDPQPIASMSRTLHLKAYGTDQWDEQKFKDAYLWHYIEVVNHFPFDGNLLAIDITNGHGWEQLCPFLGVPIPDRPFPRTR